MCFNFYKLLLSFARYYCDKKGVSKVDLRHELKHRITPSDALAIKSRLSLIATSAAHAKDGVYFIRSLYFDNINDKALREKLDGVPSREKFRIRYYILQRHPFIYRS